jgi:hypothetical protein
MWRRKVVISWHIGVADGVEADKSGGETILREHTGVSADPVITTIVTEAGLGGGSHYLLTKAIEGSSCLSMSNTTPTIANLQRALAVAGKIQQLQAELASILGGAVPSAPAKSSPAVMKPAKTGKRTMSPEARARIAAAQKARWAKLKGEKAPAAVAKAVAKPAVKVKGKKGGLTPEGRASLAAKMKARWAARKKGAPALNAPAKPAPAAKPAAKAKAKRNISPEARAKMAAAAKKRWANLKKA